MPIGGRAVRGEARRMQLSGQATRYAPPARRWSARRLDVLLELLERRDMTATDLRVLLAFVDRERTLGELTGVVQMPTTPIKRIAGRLCLAGLLRQAHDPETDEPAYAITARGLATLKPLVTAATPRGAR